jgi:uncharacterized protein YndB with AHSA1/START domain
MNATTIRPAPVKKTLAVRAPPEKAFKVFTEGFERWWPKGHTVGTSPMARAVIEPRLGGRWYEIGEDGSECQWGEVLAWEPPARVMLAWRLSTEWKADPNAYSEVEVLFTALPDGTTRVDFEHRKLEGLGAGAEQLRAQLDGGWAPILADFQAAAEA